MISTKNYLLQQLKDNLEQEGYFWRLARTDTFIDLLKVQAGKSSTTGLNKQLAVEVILINLKALLNIHLGPEEFTSDFKKLNKKLFQQQDLIVKHFDQILSDNLLKLDAAPTNHSADHSEELSYFNALSKIEVLSNSSTAIFEEILITFLGYLNSKHP